MTTVSPTYAREMQGPEYGMGLDGLLRERSDSVIGILNGVDYDEWDPASDTLIPANYTSDNLAGKAICKRELMDDFGLEGGAKQPLIGIVSRLVGQKGFELVENVMPGLLQERDFSLAVLGSGEPRYEQFFGRLQQAFRDRVCFYRGYSNKLAHWIEAGTDLFLMPSLYEPCGLNQMYSLKYGTVPIVRETGGLADSVELVNPDAGTGTGIVFDHYNDSGLRWAIRSALDLYANRAAAAKDCAQRHGAGFFLGAPGRAVRRPVSPAEPLGMNVIFVEPCFPANQREFVRALHAAGANVIGIGERPVEYLGDEVSGQLVDYVQVRSVVHEPSLLAAVRAVQGKVWVDRLEATVEAHIMAAAAVREATGIPGTSVRTAYLCRDKPAMKEALRKAGIACAQSTRATTPGRGARFCGGGRLSADHQAARGRRRGRHLSRPRCRDARAGNRRIGACRRPGSGDRGVHRRARGLYRHDHDRWQGRARIHHALLPERARGDARALDLAADGRDQSHRCAGLHGGARDDARGDQGARHRHLGNAHGVVLRAQGPEVLGDRLPPARRLSLGRLQRGERVRPLLRVGMRRSCTGVRQRNRRAATPPA